MFSRAINKITISLLFVFYVISVSNIVYATKFTSDGTYSMEGIPANKVWLNKTMTSYGCFKLRFKNLGQIKSVGNRYSLTIWLNNDEILKGAFPELKDDHYEFTIFKEEDSEKYFLALQKKDKAILYGYDNITGKFKLYLDSAKIKNDVSLPKFNSTKDGDIQLYYHGTGDEYGPRYKLIYNSYKDTFTYEDITISPPPPVIESKPEPEPYYYDYEAYEVVYVKPMFEEEEESGVGNVLDDY